MIVQVPSIKRAVSDLDDPAFRERNRLRADPFSISAVMKHSRASFCRSG